MIHAAVIDALVAAGATAEMLAAAHRADQQVEDQKHAIEEQKLAEKRSKDAARKRAARAASRNVQRTSADSNGHPWTFADAPDPLKVSPTPPLNTPPSEPDGSADVVGEDPKARLFRIGKTILASFGIAEKRTGALLGQWLKQRNDPVGLLAAITFARDQNVAEPVAYISTLVHGDGHGRAKKSGAELAFELAEEVRREERARGIG